MTCKVTVEFMFEASGADDACDQVTKKLQDAGIEFDLINVEEIVNRQRPELN